jgi:hypothetical protein
MGWFIVRNREYEYPMDGCIYPAGVKGGEDAGVLSSKNSHRLQVGVDGDKANIYVDGVYKGSWNMSGLNTTTRVGLIGGDYEITPADWRFDNFKVTPDSDCTP